MLKNDFFTIENISEQPDNKLIAEIKLNPKHKIFKGHFPGNPVVPGVVSVQMINEISAEYLGKELMLTNAKSIKFPAMINPKKNQKLFFDIKYTLQENNSYKVVAQIYFEETVFLKFNGNFSIINF